MAREYKHYGIRKARSPKNLGPLATTIAVTTEEGSRGFGYVHFAESLTKAVGKKLPRGVSQQDPAFLEITYVEDRREWEISARYLASDGAALLWRTDTKPSWLNVRGTIQ